MLKELICQTVYVKTVHMMMEALQFVKFAILVALHVLEEHSINACPVMMGFTFQMEFVWLVYHNARPALEKKIIVYRVMEIEL
jgi:hypothetical protein